MNLKVTIILIITSCFILSCGKKANQPKQEKDLETIEPSLQFNWETDSLLTTCEAVLYDDTSKIIYVANINEEPWEKDNNGFISTINDKGEILNLKWIEGLSGPKGMGISNGKLYVNDIDAIVEIDIQQQKILNRYEVPNNPQLNDITVSPNGVVYSSGSNSNTIYKLDSGKVVVLAEGDLNRLNGLLWQKEGMYYLESGNQNFGILNMNDLTFKTLTTGIGHGDGVVRLQNGDFIISSWKGAIFYINSKDWTKSLLLNTEAESIQTADIDYIPSTQTLLIPTFFNNRVKAYKVNMSK